MNEQARPDPVPPPAAGILIIADVSPQPGEYVQNVGAAQVRKSIDELTATWKQTLDEVTQLIERSLPAAFPAGLGLDQIELSLAVTAEGGLGFIAKAGVQATLKVVLKKS